MGAYGGQRTFTGCRNKNTLTNYLEFMGASPDLVGRLQAAWDVLHAAPLPPASPEVAARFDRLMDMSAEALSAALNVDLRALVYMPAPGQTVIIKVEYPRSRRGTLGRVASIARDQRDEFGMFVYTPLDELERIRAALGGYYNVYEAVHQ